MNLSFSPIRQDERLALSKSGDVLTINGTPFDFSPLPEGAALPAGATGCPWIIGAVTRQDGHIYLTLRLPHGANAPQETRFPAEIVQTEDGDIALPPYDIAVEMGDNAASEEDPT